MEYHIRSRHKIVSEVWKTVEQNGSLGDLDCKNDDFVQTAINDLNSIKHSPQTRLIGTPLNEMTFGSNLLLNTRLHMSYTYK